MAGAAYFQSLSIRILIYYEKIKLSHEKNSKNHFDS